LFLGQPRHREGIATWFSKAVLLLGIATAPSFAGIGTITAFNNHAASGTSVVVSVTASAGDTLFIVAATNPGGGGCGAATITASGTNTYTVISQQTQGFDCAADLYAKNVSGGTYNVTINWSGASVAIGAVIFDIPGADTASPLVSSNQ